MAVGFQPSVAVGDDLFIRLSEQFPLIECGGFHIQQADESVAGHDVEIDVGERFELLGFVGAGDEGEEQTQPCDLDGFGHQVGAEEVVGDDLLLAEIIDRRVIGAFVVEPVAQGLAAVEFDPGEDGGVEVDEGLHRRHQKRAGPARRIEQRKPRQHFIQQARGEFVIELFQQLRNRLKPAQRQAGDAWPLGIDRIQHQPMNGALAEVVGDFRAGVVGTEGFIVDVLFEDVAEHIRVDFIVFPAGDIVEIPTEAGEEVERGGERIIRPVDRCAGKAGGLFDGMFEEQPAVEIADVAEDGLGGGGTFIFRFGKTFEEKQGEEIAVEAVRWHGRPTRVLGFFPAGI